MEALLEICIFCVVLIFAKIYWPLYLPVVKPYEGKIIKLLLLKTETSNNNQLSESYECLSLSGKVTKKHNLYCR